MKAAIEAWGAQHNIFKQVAKKIPPSGFEDGKRKNRVVFRKLVVLVENDDRLLQAALALRDFKALLLNFFDARVFERHDRLENCCPLPQLPDDASEITAS